MKLFVSISLSLIFLFQSLGPAMDWCCELPKVDNFIKHYTELKQESQISFFEFIADHYGKDKTYHNDGYDGELPFQQNHSCCHVHVLVYNTSEVSYQIFLEIENNTSPDFYRFNKDSGISLSVFQPPRLG
ncbi:hypothetical protein GUB10_09300 [Salegentibacter sp. BLCTC]|uniref:hypothetical protein n=1 Tax=Salegentibacter sp. BLCTC TaxID=2697368 RepID=UPI00187B340E|nr:hypothetical protein [Salegentibacter sp. BLCTC]MBE7640527.1 hypothetical protein [Salegentibacter sp. BLCTC]